MFVHFDANLLVFFFEDEHEISSAHSHPVSSHAFLHAAGPSKLDALTHNCKRSVHHLSEEISKVFLHDLISFSQQ
jgi:hypothetical protein